MHSTNTDFNAPKSLIMKDLTPEQRENFLKEWKELGKDIGKLITIPKDATIEFNEPTHYHTHELDTIEFLKRGFPPQVLTGFLIGNIIKYTQRFEYKNGKDDVLKIVDYSKRLLEWYDKTHE